MPYPNKKSILLVDDEHDILDPLGAFLRRQGYAVFTADNGTDALKLAKKELPGLVILDLMLPDIDGSEVAAELLNNALTRDIPIIFLTGVLTKADQERVGPVIANRRIIAKPCRPEEILAIVKEQIGPAQ